MLTPKLLVGASRLGQASPSRALGQRCLTFRLRSCCPTAYSTAFTTAHLFSFRASGTDRAGSAATGASGLLTAERFAELTPMILLETALRQHTMLAGTAYAERHAPGHNHVVLSRKEFDEFCDLAHVTDTDAALRALDEAAIVVSLDGGTRVHLRSVQYLEELDVLQALQSSATGRSEHELSDFALPPSFTLVEVEERIRALEAKERAMRKALEPAIARAARWRRAVWGGALLYAGAQLAVIARLTYFDLDWDTMEPVSYCLAIGTALLFYLYYLYYDAEHTYVDFDKRFLPRRVHKYAPADFDWKAYYAICQELIEERGMRERLRKWANTH